MTNNPTNTDLIKEKLELNGTKTNKKRWGWVVIILVLILSSAGYFFLVTNKSEKIKYITAEVQRKDLTITVSATGNLEPTNAVDVGIEVSGTVISVNADFNQHVNKGDVLVRLDTTKLESRVRNSQAALLVAKANLSERKIILDEAKNELERGKQMYKSTNGNYPSSKELDALKNDYDKAIANYNASSASVTQADAGLKSDENDLKKAIVTSPMDGIVLDRKIEVGQTVASSMQTPILFTLAQDLTKMQVILSVDEADIGQVTEGQKVLFSVDAYPAKKFNGVITQVRFNSIIVSGVVTYQTVVEVDNSQLLLRPGMTATAEIITQVIKDTLVVPNAALRFTPEGKTSNKQGKQVWILEKNIPKSVTITSGLSDGIVTQLSDNTLNSKMKVIVDIDKKK